MTSLKRITRRASTAILSVSFIAAAVQVLAAPLPINPIESFPSFEVPGRETQMQLIRELYWLHYPGSGPKATIWDEWLVEPSLWPAVEQTTATPDMRAAWADALSHRVIMQDGYVSSHQHKSIAHQQGWPFPFWSLSPNTYGWHFSFKDTVGAEWRPQQLSGPEGWTFDGLTSAGIDAEGWQLRLQTPNARATAVPINKVIAADEAPFMQIRWQSKDLDNTQPFLEWATKAKPEFDEARRFYFAPPEGPKMVYTMVSMYRHPEWTGEITRLRLNFGNDKPSSVCLQALFSQYDTRHNINNSSYLDGCIEYFWWTQDLNFLRRNLDRMRVALRYMLREGKLRQEHVYVCDWVGHDGRSGIAWKDGKIRTLHGHGIGSNYWDLLPFGARDCYATLRSYSTLKKMAQLESEILRHPEWNMPVSVVSNSGDDLSKLADELKARGNEEFWTTSTGRFIPCIDADGKPHDYGLTFLNLEAIYYGFATPEHARSIMDWLGGKRVVNDDTSTGTDIYHWRFGPRSTTKRNVDWYCWVWNSPQTIAWGNQVQDGGAVLGWTYHDLVSRIRVNGPDDAAERLKQITDWFSEVKAAGGYRGYYDGSHEGTLQGGNKPGGLGFDQEFFESVLAPQVMLHGFMGFRPTGEGFALNPKVPSAWPHLKINHVAVHDSSYAITATSTTTTIQRERSHSNAGFVLRLPAGESWTASWQDGGTTGIVHLSTPPSAWKVDWQSTATLKLARQ